VIPTSQHILIYTTIAFGFWYIVGAAKISYPLRIMLRKVPLALVDSGVIKEGVPVQLLGTSISIFLDLIQCAACFGFWTGLFAGGVLGFDFQESILVGLYTCATNLILSGYAGQSLE
jgi:hypothetical protein